MGDRCPTDVYYEFHGMKQRNYNPIEIARQYAPKFDKPVVDMVAVVRCRDCKHCLIHDKILFCGYLGSIGEWRYRTETDFCSRGERKESEE